MKNFLVHVTLSLLILLPTHGYVQSNGNHDSGHAKLIALDQEVSQLREEVYQLKTEIQQLRRLLAMQPSSATNLKSSGESVGAMQEGATNNGYWCTKSSNKRHNSSCRYYKTSNGRPCGPNDGIPCKLCGG